MGIAFVEDYWVVWCSIFLSSLCARAWIGNVREWSGLPECGRVLVEKVALVENPHKLTALAHLNVTDFRNTPKSQTSVTLKG